MRTHNARLLCEAVTWPPFAPPTVPAPPAPPLPPARPPLPPPKNYTAEIVLPPAIAILLMMTVGVVFGYGRHRRASRKRGVHHGHLRQSGRVQHTSTTDAIPSGLGEPGGHGATEGGAASVASADGVGGSLHDSPGALARPYGDPINIHAWPSRPRLAGISGVLAWAGCLVSLTSLGPSVMVWMGFVPQSYCGGCTKATNLLVPVGLSMILLLLRPSDRSRVMLLLTCAPFFIMVGAIVAVMAWGATQMKYQNQVLNSSTLSR